ncbi:MULTISPECIES: hypothetical protein [unclassified Providencia]|uniref:hypothetical protein n=1 Tax=unclassified Providencia TaxID=2633465 RepID=UPI00234B14AD|nr:MULTISPECIES: hypothetical protein [unclassified Providencia]
MTIDDPLLIDVNLPLDKLLKNASHEELVVLTDIVTDKGKGRVSLSNEVNKLLRHHKARHTLHQVTDILALEICAFGGNTLSNMVRSSKVDYRVVVQDVAKKLGAKIPKDTSLIKSEELLIQKVLEKVLKDKKSVASIEQFCIQQGIKFDHTLLEKLKQKGNAAELASFILNYAGPYAISSLLTAALMSGSGIVLGANWAALGVAALNPVIAGLSAIWLTYGLSGPAYRVTIPAVICIATIRQKWCKSLTDYYCMELKKCL